MELEGVVDPQSRLMPTWGCPHGAGGDPKPTKKMSLWGDGAAGPWWPFLVTSEQRGLGSDRGSDRAQRTSDPQGMLPHPKKRQNPQAQPSPELEQARLSWAGLTPP